MTKRSTLWVGIDDDKRKLVTGTLKGSKSTDPKIEVVPNEDRALQRWVRRLIREAEGAEIRMCYEAGPGGFALKRRLESFGQVRVEVMAPSLTPRRSGQRVKTDRVDARKLALLFRSGELAPIGVPQEEDEAARDLVRTLHLIRRETVAKRHQIHRFLLRRGRIWQQGENWTLAYRQWARNQVWENWADTVTLEEMWTGLSDLEAREKRLQVAELRLAQEEKRAYMVGVLCCFNGIDTDSAMTLCTEVFDIDRFSTARSFMSYMGLTVAVRQSGDREYRGGISKIGNSHARWILGQAAWNARRRPYVGRTLERRRRGQPAWAIAIADRAQHRLYRRYWHFIQRGKSPQKAVTAVARELAGFVWEAMLQAQHHGQLAA